ncbi:MAG: hypothetical protein K6B46_00670 [Opitutales bacterium]|nr:hypothetical protein [Opitutales bacterium]
MEENLNIADEAFEALLRESAVPVAPSADFEARLEGALAEDAAFEALLRENAVPVALPADFEARLAGTPGLQNAVRFDFKKVIRVFSALTAAGAIAVAGLLSFRGNADSVLLPEYHLVSDENTLVAIDDSLEPVLQDDGTVVRPTRYVYSKTRRWQDAHSSKQMVSDEECEQVVPVVFAIY